MAETMTINTKKRGWKKAMAGICRRMLWNAELNKPLSDIQYGFLMGIIGYHHEAVDKVGCGVAAFVVRENEWRKRTFWIIRNDGSEADFSFLKCLTPPTAMRDFATACRHAVIDQVLEFKNSIFDHAAIVTCQVSGETVDRTTAHIDHEEPWTFAKIVEEFAKDYDVSAEVKPTADGDLRTYFKHPETEKKFQEFHRERAKMRVVSRTANLSILKRKP